jgi:hypothetical protein
VEPKDTGLASVRVIEKVLQRAGLAPGDIALWEINEAFASVPIAACRAFGLDEDLVNVHGSGCSLGHPIAASGARMLTTLVHELRRRGGGVAVAAMCAGGGQGGAVILENVVKPLLTNPAPSTVWSAMLFGDNRSDGRDTHQLQGGMGAPSAGSSLARPRRRFDRVLAGSTGGGVER